MACKIAEEISIVPVLACQGQEYGTNDTGAYLKCPPGRGSIDFVVRYGALAQGKSVTVEVYQATAAAGTGAAEITAYETTATAPSGGATDGTIIISVDNSDVDKGYVTVKVSNDAASGSVPIDAFAMIRKELCG